MTIEERVSEEHSVHDFVRDYGAHLFRYAYLLTGSRADSEDLVHDVLVKLLERESEWHRINNPRSYARSMLTNDFTSRGRRHARWLRLRHRLVEPEVAEGPQDAAALRDQLWTALQAVPARQRAAVVLRYYEDLGYPEIGEVLGCPPTTARSLAARGLARLRVQLEDHPLRPVPMPPAMEES